MEYRSIHGSLCILPAVRYELEMVVGGQSEVDCYIKNSSLTADGFRRLTAMGETDDLANYAKRDIPQPHDAAVRLDDNAAACSICGKRADVQSRRRRLHGASQYP